jgi:hypothetical protein
MVTMPHRRWICTAILLTATFTTACHFDPSTDNDVLDPEQLDEPADEGDSTLNPKPPEAETSLLLHAVREDIRRGYLVDGDFRATTTMDKTVEKILGELSSDTELLKQRWYLDAVPEGQYEMTLVAKAYSPIDPERYQVSYRMSDSSDWMELFRFSSGSVLTSHVYRVDVPSLGDLEIEATLMDDAPIVEQSEDGISFNNWPGSGNNGNGNSYEVQKAYRILSVDYLGLRQTLAPSN